MGMFDYVNFKMPCPRCGEELKNFQSKDSDCYMGTVEPESVCRFYGSCECGAWVEFERARKMEEKRAVPLTLEQVQALGFSMEVRDNGRLTYEKEQEKKRADAAGDRQA